MTAHMDKHMYFFLAPDESTERRMQETPKLLLVTLLARC